VILVEVTFMRQKGVRKTLAGEPCEGVGRRLGKGQGLRIEIDDKKYLAEGKGLFLVSKEGAGFEEETRDPGKENGWTIARSSKRQGSQENGGRQKVKRGQGGGGV